MSTFLQRSKLSFCFMLLLLFVSLNAWSQSGSVNPFEIKTDQAADETKVEESEVDSSSIAKPEPTESKTVTNPFEQVGSQEKGLNNTSPILPASSSSSGNPFEISPLSESSADIKKKEQPRPKKPKPAIKDKKEIDDVGGSSISSNTSNNSGFIFMLIVIITVLFAVLLTLFRGYFAKVYQAFINDSQLRSAYREMGSTIIIPYIVLYGMFIINASVLLYVVLTKNGIHLGDNWKSWFYILIGLLLVFLGKHLMLSFFGGTFPVSKEVKLYNFTIVIFNIMLGVIFVPIALLYAYGPDNLLVVLTYLTASIVILIYIYRSVRVLLIGGKYLSTHKFHFFMYLCTAEIAPLLLLVRFISKNLY